MKYVNSLNLLQNELQNAVIQVLATGAHDAYKRGDKVTFEGKHYISLIDANVYSPTAYPAGWQEQA